MFTQQSLRPERPIISLQRSLCYGRTLTVNNSSGWSRGSVQSIEESKIAIDVLNFLFVNLQSLFCTLYRLFSTLPPSIFPPYVHSVIWPFVCVCVCVSFNCYSKTVIDTIESVLGPIKLPNGYDL